MGILDTLGKRFRRNGVDLAKKPKPPTGGAVARGDQVFGAGGLLDFSHLLSKQMVDWFGPHTPNNIPVFALEAMRRDETIALTMRARKAVLMSADYGVECKESDEIRVFSQEMLDRHRYKLLSTGLTALELGFIVNQLVWGTEDITLNTVDKAGPKATILKNAFVVKEIRDFDPMRTEILVDEKGDYRGAVIDNATLSKIRSILYTHQAEFGKLHGRSGMLPAYNPWWWSNLVKQNANIYFEQKGNPVYIGRAPDKAEWGVLTNKGASTETIDQFDPVVFMNTALLNARSGGSFTMPSSMRTDDAGNATQIPLFDVKMLDVPERKDEFVGYLNYLDLLKVRGCLGNDLVVLVGSPGQAGAKAGGRLFHSMLRPDQEEWAHITNESFLRPLIEANFGVDAPRTIIRSGFIAENKAELMMELFKQLVSSTQRLPDGRSYEAGSLVNVVEILRAIGIPSNDVDAVATDEPPPPEPGEAPPRGDPEDGGDMPPDPGGRPKEDTEEDPQFDDDEVPEKKDEAKAGKLELSPPPAPINVHLQPSDPPIINLTVPEREVNVNVEPAAPDITVEAASPDVTLNVESPKSPDVTVNPSEVNVDVQVKGGDKKITLTREDGSKVEGTSEVIDKGDKDG